MDTAPPTLSPPLPDIALNIRDAREAKSLTQLALAHRIGYRGDDAGAYICRLEAGAQEPRLSTVTRLAKALGVSVGHLLRVRGK